ncbi:MAG TPA: PfkB family carbohydrate kinase, partial [Candidatus Dormibacteraeota bacterium]|nr:PfkB family carbohydrate kinase [Candidatus Dormibacteraeota bacterium]
SLNSREVDALGGVDAVMSRAQPAATVIVRRGPEGATIHAPGSEPLSIPSITVQAVDTSGAGDVHVGANLAGLARGLSWPDAVLLANRAAAYAVSRPGPAAGPTDEQLEVFRAGRW